MFDEKPDCYLFILALAVGRDLATPSANLHVMAQNMCAAEHYTQMKLQNASF